MAEPVKIFHRIVPLEISISRDIYEAIVSREAFLSKIIGIKMGIAFRRAIDELEESMGIVPEIKP